ncbi:MAG: virulence factor family protein [Geminicoccaceae bacterium]
MISVRPVLFFLLACLWAGVAAAQDLGTINGLTLGTIEVRRPAGEPKGLVFLFSDRDGPSADFRLAIDRLVERGLIVAPVALAPFLRRQDGLGRECLYLVSDIEEASRRIQAAGGRDRYLTPIVTGTGMGGAVAYAALAQAPDATLAGAASDGFTTRIDTRFPLCAGAPVSADPAGGFDYGPHPLPGWWRVTPLPDDTQAAQEFAAAAGAEDALVPAPEGGLADRLLALIEPALQAAGTDAVAALPLVELPPTAPGEVMAIVYSGDGGWRDIDKDIAGRLHELGMPVVGVDSLRYFWTERTPEASAADLARIIAHYRQVWDRSRIVLIGYSFGADVLPFLVNRLPEAERAALARISLLALSRTADFEIHVTGWLGVDAHEGSLPTVPELAKMPLAIVQCFYGAEETDSACMLPELKGAQIIQTPGGHHFDGDYGKLADAIARGFVS